MIKKILFLSLLSIFSYSASQQINTVDDALNYQEELYNKLNYFCFKVFRYVIDNKLVEGIEDYTNEQIQQLYGSLLSYALHHETIRNNVVPLCNELVQYEKAIYLCEKRENTIMDMSHISIMTDAFLGCGILVSIFSGIPWTTQNCQIHDSIINFSSCQCQNNTKTISRLHFFIKSLLCVMSANQIFSFFITHNKHMLFKNKKIIQEFQNKRLEELYSTVYNIILNVIMTFFENENEESQQQYIKDNF